MTFEFRVLQLVKRYPLTISRGTQATSQNLFVRAEHQGVVGWGEAAPGTGHGDDFAEAARTQLASFVRGLDVELSREGIAEVWRKGREAGLPAPALAGLDCALWDLLARREGKPLYQLLGLAPTQVVSSVTIGINPTEVVRERAVDTLVRTQARALKIKLGSPQGIAYDQSNYLAVLEASRHSDEGGIEAGTNPERQSHVRSLPRRDDDDGVRLRVDANGGWSLDDAKLMLDWLAERGCDYVEQPLPKGHEDRLPDLFQGRPLPIFADESCHFSEDVAELADRVDGVNLKLMKCGGITEALRIVDAARQQQLQTMIGCMSESSVAIASGAAMGALFDHIDLDSNLNLIDEPVMREMEWKEGGWDLTPVQFGHGSTVTRSP